MVLVSFLLLLPHDIEDIINSFLKNHKQELVKQIPYAVSCWWWRRGYIKSPTGKLYWLRETPNFFY